MRRTLVMTLAAVTLLAAGASHAEEKAGDIVYLKGAGIVERQAQQLKAELKFPLLESDNVMTKEQARMKILFKDDSILTLGPSSKLIIKQYFYAPDKKKRAESIYELADGKLKVVVGSAGFKVTTPTAFAAARGTILVLWFVPQTNTTFLMVLEGEVEIRNIKDSVKGTRVVKAGQVSSVTGDNPPTEPESFDLQNEIGRGTDLGLLVMNLGDIPPPVLIRPDLPGARPSFDTTGPVVLPVAPPISQQPVNATTRVNINLAFP